MEPARNLYKNDIDFAALALQSRDFAKQCVTLGSWHLRKMETDQFIAYDSMASWISTMKQPSGGFGCERTIISTV